VAFVGVGAIGLPMAARIAAGGHALVAIDPDERRRELARGAGLTVAGDVARTADADVVIVMVATPAQLDAALCAPGGALDHMRRGALCVVMSTVGREAVRAAHAAAAARGCPLLDVPVTGGVSGARRGALTLLAAGDAEAIAGARPVLERLGAILICGDEVGQGQAMKLVNQLLATVHVVAAAEALAFAERLGLDPAAALQAVAAGAAGSWMLTDRGPRMLQGEGAEVTAAIDLFVKDSGMVAAAADAAGLPTPLLAAAREVFERAADAGLGHADDSQVIQIYREAR